MTAPKFRAVAGRPLLLVFGGQILLGLIAGAAWRLWAPRTIGYVVQGTNGGSVFIPAESEGQISGDGRFLLLTVVVGLAAGFTSWFLLRTRRGPLTLLALTVGALASSLVARWFGELLSSHTVRAADQVTEYPALTLHGEPILFVQAFAAVLIYVALAGFSSNPTLRPTDPVEPEQPAALVGR